MPESEKAWITAAWDDSTTFRAIVLAKSLRKVVTCGKIVVVITEDISEGLRELLADTFDVLQDIKLGSNYKNGLSVLDKVKISLWKFYWWKKCVFLEPDTIVIKNCDELLENCDAFSAPLCEDALHASNIFFFQPSYSVYKQLENLATEKSFKNVSELFKSFFQTWKPLPSDYFSTAKILDSTEPKARIVSLSHNRPWQNIENNGMAAGENVDNDPITKQWLGLFFKDVFPNLLPHQIATTNLDLQKIKSLKELMESGAGDKTTSKNVHNYLQDSIAVIGYSCRFPASNNRTEFWDLLKNGGDGITQMPAERLTESQLEDPRFTSVLAGFLKCPIDEFDAKFFGISPREAVYMDPQQRLLTEVAWEALENAGINPHSLKGSNTGVFTGVWTHEYETLLSNMATGADFHHVVLGNAYSATSARVSYVLGLNGPNIVTESGCSSSMVSLHLACQSLRRNESEMTLVGGVNLLCAQFPHSEVSILARDGHCKTFDEKADGFSRGEGVGVLVLKKYSDAIRDGDRIMAIIRGTGISNEGTTTSFGTPSKYCQSIAIREAIKDSGVDPLIVDYVEAHGTGTPIGDPIEFGAIASVYSGDRPKPLMLGSVKTNIGHSEAAAGLAGIIKVMMAMENELIPLHRNLDTLNPNIDLKSVPAVIPTSSVEWPRRNQSPRLAGVSSFGISGTNVHVIMQETPQTEENTISSSSNTDTIREHEILTLSAKSEEGVKDLVQKYISYFEWNPDANLKDVIFTANNGRAHFKHRIAVIGKNVSEMKSSLEKEHFISGIANINQKPVVAFLFTGQGSQYIGMAKSLYESSKIFRENLDSCARILRNNFTISLFDILWNSDLNLNGDACIDQTLYSQIAIFCIEYGLLRLWESFGVKPDCVLGHSVGEFAAAVAAGVLDLKDAITLVSERSRLIHNLPKGKMVAVRMGLDMARSLIDEFHKKNGNPDNWIDIAVINSNDEVVLAGKEESLLNFLEYYKTNKLSLKSQVLAASHAFHSRDMEGMLHDFGKVADTIEYKEPKCTYISGSSGVILNKEDFSSAYWQKHARHCVDFAKSVKSLESRGCNTFIEIGAHPILLALTMNNLGSDPENQYLWIPTLRKTEYEWVTILNSVGKLYIGGFNIDWGKISSVFGRKKLELPTYPFRRQRFWVEQNSLKNEMALGGKLLHPLLGNKIPSAEYHLYQNDLDIQRLPYLEDHQVANIVILPGAGFLEMILAAGRDVYKTIDGKENCSLFVNQFLIEAPLELESGKLCRVQTVATPKETGNVIDVKVYLYCNLNGYSDEKGWKCYASAKVSSSPFTELKSGDEKSSIENSSEDLGAKLKFTSLDIDEVKSRCEIETTTEEYYKKVPEIGIFFGKTFQSISKVWKAKNEALGFIPVPENAGNMQDYVYHPVVLDAMIQGFGITISEGGEEKKDLYLPIGIDNFTMLNYNSTPGMYAHITWTEGSTNGHVALFDEKGKILSVMEGIKLVRTSLTSFLNVINAHNNKLPGMFTEIWRGRDGPSQSRIDYTTVCSFEESTKFSFRDEYTFLGKELREQATFLDTTVFLEILKTFKEIGWKPVLGENFTAKQLVTDLLIKPEFEMLIDQYLYIFYHQKALERQFDFEQNCLRYTYSEPFPSATEIDEKLEKMYQIILDRLTDEGEYCCKVYKHAQSNLAEVLLGKKLAVSSLFGGEVDPFKLYSLGPEQRELNNYIARYIAAFYETAIESESIVRILEVGGGTGVTASCVIPLLQKKGIPYRYTFTDISNHFLEEAKKKFKDYSGIEYKLLNLEEDPKQQGYSPFYYDVVIAANVVHTTENIRASMQHLRHLLVPNGILCMLEIINDYFSADLIFGPLPGFFRFKDFDLRPAHCAMNLSKWEMVLSETEFSSFECPFPKCQISAIFAQASDLKYTSDLLAIKNRTWPNAIKSEKPPCVIVFDDESDTSKLVQEKLKEVGSNLVRIFYKDGSISGKHDFIVDPSKNETEIQDIMSKIVEEFNIHTILYFWSTNSFRDQEYICHGLLHLVQFLNMLDEKNLKLITVTRGANYIGDQGVVNPSLATADGLVTTFRNERCNGISLIIDLDPDKVNANIESEELFFEIWSNSSNEERNVAFRNCRKFVNRLASLEKPSPPLRIPTQQRYCLVVPTTKSINDVSYRPVGKVALEPFDVEVAVKATALNFRDIFVILKPDMFKSLYESVGTDFSGIVSDIGSQVTKFKVGDEVFGISNATSVASHVIVPHDLIMVKPKQFTFSDAATLPSVFLTTYYCLFEIAQLKSGETILIHVASGGVGLVAIQLAKKIGAKIIATAGSKRKRAYLRSIGIEHVFHSRDISYGDEIERVTQGKGVDMVLNSITGPNFKETSLRVCAQNARFVEMGKVNIWQPEDVSKLRPDVQYSIVDLEKADKSEMETIIDKMDDLFKNQSIEPLPYTRFEGSQIKEALNYFLKAQHIGKIVVAMPECSVSKQVAKDIIFDSESTYLITGGLGGIGLEVAKWMASCGARNLVLVARSKPDEKAVETINNLISKGCRTLSFQVDVGKFNECKNLFEIMNNLELPPLRGVIHSAGALSDDFIKNQTWEKLQIVFNAKVNGGWNLHELTKDMRLEFFVLFSSLAGAFGSPAQINHAAANLYLDALAKYRYSIGLPAQVIDWGAWSEVGAATNTVYGKEGAFGVKPITPAQGIASLKYIMTRPFNRAGVVQCDFTYMTDYLIAVRKYLEEVATQTEIITSAQSAAEAEAFWQDIKDMDLEERTWYLKKYLEKTIRKTLKLPDSEQIDEHQTFSDMGLDSLMAVEMRNKVQNVFGKYVTVNPTSLLDYPTLASLSKYLAEITLTVDIDAMDFNNKDGKVAVESLDNDDLKNLIKEDSILPAHITSAGDDIIKASNISSVFLTGVTGHLGVHIFSEICKIKNVKVTCLIRAKNVETARKRLVGNLKKFELMSLVDLTGVELVTGNVAEKNLGLSDETYEKLSSSTDAIIHCAVKANHVEHYKKSSGKVKADLRSVNTIGTLNILEFAANKKTKRLIYPGSFSSANEFTDDGYLSENIPMVDNLGEGIHFGYGISKLVSEKLIGQAIERGIPCTIFRYPSLTGNSDTGHFTIDSNFFMRGIITLGQLGYAPKLNPNWYSIPVNIAAKVTSRLIFDDLVQTELYNLIQPETLSIDQCAQLASDMGFNIAVVPTQEFEEKFKNDDSLALSLASTYISKDQSLLDYVTNTCPALKLGLEQGKNIYCKSSKILNILPNFYEMIPDPIITLNKHTEFAKKMGILDTLKIKL